MSFDIKPPLFICLGSSSASIKHTEISFNNLIIEKELGEGSYGKVYLGKWNYSPVALKFCKKGLDADDFLRELKILMYVLPPYLLLRTMVEHEEREREK
jgi:serine/threonine protein kinase